MNLLDRSTIKIEGIRDFEWAPATPQREAVKTYEQLLSYWTPEILVCILVANRAVGESLTIESRQTQQELV